MLSSNELIALVTVVAAVIANSVDTDDLSVISAVFVQLGDTLVTYAAQKERLN